MTSHGLQQILYVAFAHDRIGWASDLRHAGFARLGVSGILPDEAIAVPGVFEEDLGVLGCEAGRDGGEALWGEQGSRRVEGCWSEECSGERHSEDRLTDALNGLCHVRPQS